MFNKNKSLLTLIKRFDSIGGNTYIDVNCKRVSPTLSSIVIKLSHGVFLYTDTQTFSGLFEFLKEWNIGGNKIWKNGAHIPDILGYNNYGVFFEGELCQISLEDRLQILSKKERNMFEVDSMDGFCKTFGRKTSKLVYLDDKVDCLVLKLGKCTELPHVSFKYRCTSCHSEKKRVFTDSRFDYTNGIVYQKCVHIFGDVITNPICNISVVNAICFDCTKNSIMEEDVRNFRCKCGLVRSTRGTWKPKWMNGTGGEFYNSSSSVCMECIGDIVGNYHV